MPPASAAPNATTHAFTNATAAVADAAPDGRPFPDRAAVASRFEQPAELSGSDDLRGAGAIHSSRGREGETGPAARPRC
ncbi:hypothetical protein ACH4RA_03115 [Streptomyces smyrnaeus]|uniref:hypothetical protein n=1 Tax=Streptomyces smyrnaeus TaxID=1387713 RepID=UPI0037BA90DB